MTHPVSRRPPSFLDPLTTPLGVLAAIALGLAAGAMLAEGGVLVPYWRSLPADAFLRWYADNASRLLDFFGPLEGISTLLAAVTAVLYRVRRLPGTLWLALAASLAVAVLATFPLYFQEVNASFAAGTIAVEQVPEELGRWAAWHWARTAIGAGAFAAAVIGVRS